MQCTRLVSRCHDESGITAVSPKDYLRSIRVSSECGACGCAAILLYVVADTGSAWSFAAASMLCFGGPLSSILLVYRFVCTDLCRGVFSLLTAVLRVWLCLSQGLSAVSG